MAEQLSEHYTMEEMVSTGKVKNPMVNNYPCEAAKKQLIKVCKLLETIRAEYIKKYPGEPLFHISSGYRNHIVNKAVGSKDSSQHLRGEAADLSFSPRSDKNDRATKLWKLIDSMVQDGTITIHQLLREIDDGDNMWVHVGIGTGNDCQFWYYTSKSRRETARKKYGRK